MTIRTPRQIAAARQHDQDCRLCEHRCGVDRSVGETGRCHATHVARVFRHRVEYGEEPELVPSHLFYLSGCDLRCRFCIAGLNAFDPSRGRPLESAWFNSAIAWGRDQGAKNVQWVGGEPTIHLPRILDVMDACPGLPPVVWKSDFYGTPDAFELLEGHVQTYVADFKFGNDACARRIAGVDRYVEIVTRNLLAVAGTSARLIVRHLLLPGHAECCYRPMLAWLAERLPHVPLSLRDGFMPAWRAASLPELGRTLTVAEGRAAATRARQTVLTVIQ